MGRVHEALAAVDAYQKRHRFSAVAVAVNKKYSEDNGGNLAALTAYHGLLSVFPLLLAIFTIASYVVGNDSHAIHTLQQHLREVPVIGQYLMTGHLKGNAIALVVGVLGLAWGALGLSRTLQFAMAEIWQVPEKDRPGFRARLLKGLTWYACFGLGIIASTFVSSLGSVLNWGHAGGVIATVPALAVNVALFAISFKVLAPTHTTFADQLPGAFLSGLVWSVLTGVAVSLLQHQVAHASALYGSVGTVLGIIGFLYLAARVTLYGAELNVVRSRHLWPVSLLKGDDAEGVAEPDKGDNAGGVETDGGELPAQEQPVGELEERNTEPGRVVQR